MPRPKPSIARRIERLEEAYDEVRRLLKQLTAGSPQSIEGGLGALPSGALRLKTFLDRTDIAERTFYRLRDAGKLQVVIIGDRGVYVLLDSYYRYLRELTTAQNPAGAPPPNVKVTPPPVPRRGSDRDIGRLEAALPPSGPPPGP